MHESKQEPTIGELSAKPGTSPTERKLTHGEKAVGITFNPGGNPAVEMVKSQFANIVDHLNDLKNKTDNGEMKAMYQLAIRDAQVAQMWAVKAITWQF